MIIPPKLSAGRLGTRYAWPGKRWNLRRQIVHLYVFLGGKVHLSLNVCVVVAVVDCALLSVRRISGDCKDVYVQAEQSTRTPVSVAQRLARRRTPRSASRAALRVQLEPTLAFLQHILFWTEWHSECLNSSGLDD